jgi:hypothetical protein
MRQKFPAAGCKDAHEFVFIIQNSNNRTTPFEKCLRRSVDFPDLKFFIHLPIPFMNRLKRANHPKGWGAKPLT